MGKFTKFESFYARKYGFVINTDNNESYVFD
jgi:hypothetical protein